MRLRLVSAAALAVRFGDLVLCAGTVPQSGLAERAAAAAAAGFRALSLFPQDYRRAREAGLSDGELRRMLGDHGLAIAEIDPLLSWLPGVGDAGIDETGRGFLAHGEAEFYAIADALGARSINAALADPGELELDAIAEAFAKLCDRAAAHGLLVTLEFLPWTRIRDAATATALVERAGPANGGVMLDAWHHYRSGAPLDAISASRVLGVQLSDAPAQAEADPIAETLQRRRIPGEGDADLAGLLRHLAAGGCDAPVGVEVFSSALAGRPVEEVAQRVAAATRALLDPILGAEG